MSSQICKRLANIEQNSNFISLIFPFLSIRSVMLDTRAELFKTTSLKVFAGNPSHKYWLMCSSIGILCDIKFCCCFFLVLGLFLLFFRVT